MTARPETLTCRGGGNFVEAIERDGSLAPYEESRPECDGAEFKSIHTDTVVRVDDA